VGATDSAIPCAMLLGRVSFFFYFFQIRASKFFYFFKYNILQENPSDLATRMQGILPPATQVTQVSKKKALLKRLSYEIDFKNVD
jgi:hypothetical protein